MSLPPRFRPRDPVYRRTSYTNWTLQVPSNEDYVDWVEDNILYSTDGSQETVSIPLYCSNNGDRLIFDYTYQPVRRASETQEDARTRRRTIRRIRHHQRPSQPGTSTDAQRRRSRRGRRFDGVRFSEASRQILQEMLQVGLLNVVDTPDGPAVAVNIQVEGIEGEEPQNGWTFLNPAMSPMHDGASGRNRGNGRSNWVSRGQDDQNDGWEAVATATGSHSQTRSSRRGGSRSFRTRS